jgi:hypothetical protein
MSDISDIGNFHTSKIDPFVPAHLTALEEAGIIPGAGKHYDTRIKPLPLTNGHATAVA